MPKHSEFVHRWLILFLFSCGHYCQTGLSAGWSHVSADKQRDKSSADQQKGTGDKPLLFKQPFWDIFLAKPPLFFHILSGDKDVNTNTQGQTSSDKPTVSRSRNKRVLTGSRYCRASFTARQLPLRLRHLRASAVLGAEKKQNSGGGGNRSASGAFSAQWRSVPLFD